jgi:hypothetical protein
LKGSPSFVTRKRRSPSDAMAAALRSTISTFSVFGSSRVTLAELTHGFFTIPASAARVSNEKRFFPSSIPPSRVISLGARRELPVRATFSMPKRGVVIA